MSVKERKCKSVWEKKIVCERRISVRIARDDRRGKRGRRRRAEEQK